MRLRTEFCAHALITRAHSVYRTKQIREEGQPLPHFKAWS
nr:hypothetical protein LMSGXRPZ_LMSGXRPZ_CDS_0004 [Microvirus sp.]